MGTVVYQQGFQSSQLNEPRALRLKLSSFNSHFSPLKSHFLDSSNVEDTLNPNNDKPSPSSSGWNFLQSLSSASSSFSKTRFEKEKTFGCRTLSDESLALCTENLGSESGSDVQDLSLLDIQAKNLGETRSTETRTLRSRKRIVSTSELPPPLTTLRCIQIKPKREDGRLVMTAVNAPPRKGCFQTDRSNGRLRLSILKDSEEFEETEE